MERTVKVWQYVNQVELLVTRKTFFMTGFYFTPARVVLFSYNTQIPYKSLCSGQGVHHCISRGTAVAMVTYVLVHQCPLSFFIYFLMGYFAVVLVSQAAIHVPQTDGFTGPNWECAADSASTAALIYLHCSAPPPPFLLLLLSSLLPPLPETLPPSLLSIFYQQPSWRMVEKPQDRDSQQSISYSVQQPSQYV